MTTENKAEKKVKKPMSLKAHKYNRAKSLTQYFSDCIISEEKIAKEFIKELGDIA